MSSLFEQKLKTDMIITEMNGVDPHRPPFCYYAALPSASPAEVHQPTGVAS